MTALFLSCEHGGNKVPPDLMPRFTGHKDILNTHRGLDIGALDLFRNLAPLAQETTHATLSRLCIELNRSEHHQRLFSAYTKDIDPARKQELLKFHRAYRSGFTKLIEKRIATKGNVLHVSVHSFTPVLDGVKRTMDIGLLYDPSRTGEKTFCWDWRSAIKERMPSLVVSMNQPYKGISDGFTTALRVKFPKHYSGIEIEVNQRFATNGRMDPKVVSTLHDSLAELLSEAGKAAR